MAGISGLTSRVAYVQVPPGTGRNVGATTPTNPPMQPSTVTPAIIDGTPVRVAVLALAAAAGLVALRMAGFRFNVAVGN